MQLRARDGRAVLAGRPDTDDWDGADPWRDAHDAPTREVDPHSLAIGTDLADALHEWARVVEAMHRDGTDGGAVAALLVSRRGQQLAVRIAAVMGRPISYADPLTGEVTTVDVPPADDLDADPASNPHLTRIARWWARQRWRTDRLAPEPTPWVTGIAVAGVSTVLVLIVVVTLSLALGTASPWLALIANVVIAGGLAPSVWLARNAKVWRWVAYGVVAGIGVAWLTLLFAAL